MKALKKTLRGFCAGGAMEISRWCNHRYAGKKRILAPEGRQTRLDLSPLRGCVACAMRFRWLHHRLISVAPPGINWKIRFFEMRGLLLCALLLLIISPAFAQRTKSGRPTTGQPASSPTFDKVAAQAKEAREAGNLDEAIKLYRKAVSLRPKWEEGQWYLATLLYDRDEYAEAARAFKQVAALRPQVGAPVAMQGLCEYRLGQYDEAFIHLQQGRQRGIGDNKELLRVMAFHEATL